MSRSKLWISNLYAWTVAAVCGAGLVGCLPELDEPALTATGEAPVGDPAAAATASATGAPKATTCTGVYFGNLPGGALFAGQAPCTINGSVEIATMSIAERQQLSGVKNIQGTLYLSAPDQIAQLPALTSVYVLTLNNYNAPILDFPTRVAVQHSIIVSGGQVGQIKGFGGIKTLAGILSLEGMDKLESIDAFHALASVKTLSINNLPELKTLKSFEALTAATSVSIGHCQALTTLPSFGKLPTVALLQLSYLNGLTTVASFPALTTASSLQFSNLNGVTTVSFPALTSVNTFQVSSMAKLSDLEGFGPKLNVVSTVSVCDILMKGTDREVWKQKHAPGMNFEKCSNGCFGWGTC